jgi:hypothetical protein
VISSTGSSIELGDSSCRSGMYWGRRRGLLSIGLILGLRLRGLRRGDIWGRLERGWVRGDADVVFHAF